MRHDPSQSPASASARATSRASGRAAWRAVWCAALLFGMFAAVGCDRAVSVKVGPRAPKIKVLSETEGVGVAVSTGRTVTAHYVATTPDGDVILSTRDAGEPMRWIVGEGGVIAGMDDAVMGMRAGGRRRVEIPPELHWGRAGYGGKVPPNSPLIFEIEVMLVK